jgi:plastocyanin
MKMSSTVAIVVAVLVILGGWYAYATYYMPAATPSTGTTINTNPNGTDYTPATTSASDTSSIGADVNAGVTTGAPASAAVTLTANGFSPKTVTIKKGGTVTWKNESAGNMWVASANHPTHTVYDGTTLQQHCANGAPGSFDECGAGSTFSFTFNKTGSWNYHNHSNTSDFGTVIVQ